MSEDGGIGTKAASDSLAFSYVREVWTDAVIVEDHQTGDLWRVPFSVKDGGTPSGVRFDEPKRVRVSYVSADEIGMTITELEERYEAAGMLALAGPPVAERKKAAQQGTAMKDGSYPIRNVAELRKAIQASGRNASSDRFKLIKGWIRKRARALHREDLIPDAWKKAT